MGIESRERRGVSVHSRTVRDDPSVTVVNRRRSVRSVSVEDDGPTVVTRKAKGKKVVVKKKKSGPRYVVRGGRRVVVHGYDEPSSVSVRSRRTIHERSATGVSVGVGASVRERSGVSVRSGSSTTTRTGVSAGGREFDLGQRHEHLARLRAVEHRRRVGPWLRRRGGEPAGVVGHGLGRLVRLERRPRHVRIVELRFVRFLRNELGQLRRVERLEEPVRDRHS